MPPPPLPTPLSPADCLAIPTEGRATLGRATLGRATLVACALAAALPGTVGGLRSNAELLAGGLLNPDSAMRLVRLNDIVASGTPLHAVMRDGSGMGSLMSWSHLLDSLLLLLAAPFAWAIGWPAAIHAAGLASGPLAMAALGMAVAWAAAPVASGGWLWLGAFAAGAAPTVGGYGMLGVVHHHVLLALSAVMAAGWALRLLRGQDMAQGGAAGGGAALGAWTAFGIWLSPEAAPFALMAAGALWVSWLHAPVPRLALALRSAGLVSTALLTLVVLADPPSGGWLAAEADRVSLPFPLLALGSFAAAAMACLTGRRVPPLVCGAGAAILWLAAFPQILHGTNGLMTPEQAAAFFGPITEMQPVRGVDGVLESLVGGLFALASLAVYAWRGRFGRNWTVLLYAAFCVAGMLALAAQHVRFATYPAVAGAALLPVVLSAISIQLAPGPGQSAARLALLLLLLGAPSMAPLTASAGTRTTTAMPCAVSGAVGLLAPYPDAIVLAGVNETPDLLYRTRVRTVGSLYHRNPLGYMRLRAAWRSIPVEGGPGPELRATGATLVLGCPHEPRWLLVDGLPHTTLLDRLVAEDPPAWLHRIADAGPGGYILYGVGP